MKRSLVGMLLFGAALDVHAAPCLVRGTVVDDQSGKPLPKTRIFARPHGNKTAILRIANEEGAFCFDRLEPADYDLLTERPGYLHAVYGAVPGAEQGVLMKIDGQTELAPVIIKMIPAGSISGTVVDSSGEVVEKAEVELLRKVWDHGWRAEGIINLQTDDRGAFRFSLLAPGTYYLSVSARESRGREMLDEKGEHIRVAEVRTFYPASLEFERATPIRMKPGQELSALALTLNKITSRHLSGRLSPALQISPVVQPSIRIRSDSGSGADVNIRKDGTFSADGLIPARYRMYIEDIDGIPPSQAREVDLTAGDVTGLVIEPVQMFNVQMSARVEGESTPPSFSMWVLDTNTDFQRSARPDANGSFLFRGILAGVYRIEANRKDIFLKGILIDGKPAPSNLISFPSVQPGAVEAVFSSKMARIEGKLDSVPEKMSSIAATLVVIDEASSKMESAPVDHTGGFKLESLVPGKYRVFAIEGFDEQLWGSQELAAALASKSVSLELHEDENKQLSIPLISQTDWDAALKKIGL